MPVTKVIEGGNSLNITTVLINDYVTSDRKIANSTKVIVNEYVTIEPRIAILNANVKKRWGRPPGSNN